MQLRRGPRDAAGADDRTEYVKVGQLHISLSENRKFIIIHFTGWMSSNRLATLPPRAARYPRSRHDRHRIQPSHPDAGLGCRACPRAASTRSPDADPVPSCVAPCAARVAACGPPTGRPTGVRILVLNRSRRARETIGCRGAPTAASKPRLPAIAPTRYASPNAPQPARGGTRPCRLRVGDPGHASRWRRSVRSCLACQSHPPSRSARAWSGSSSNSNRTRPSAYATRKRNWVRSRPRRERPSRMNAHWWPTRTSCVCRK